MISPVSAGKISQGKSWVKAKKQPVAMGAIFLPFLVGAQIFQR